MPDDIPSPTTTRAPATVVGPTSRDRTTRWAAGIALGALAGFAVPHLAGWMVGLRWVPFQGLARAVDEVLGERGALGLVVCAAFGASAGAVWAAHAVRAIGVVTVDRDVVSVTRQGERADLERGRVRSVFVDRAELVVLGADDDVTASSVVELAHVPTGLATERLRSAFREHGWPWRDGDPSAEEFRLWAAGDPALPPGADAVLGARATMIDAGKAADVEALRRELGRLGVVVRDVEKAQHWRPAAGSTAGPSGP